MSNITISKPLAPRFTPGLHRLPPGMVGIDLAPSIILVSRHPKKATGSSTWYKERHRQEKLDLLGRMAEQTAHEVINPLTTIKGFLQMYQLHPDYIPWEMLWKEISAIELSIKQALTLSTNCTSQWEKIDINQLICAAYSTLENRALRQRIWLRLALTDNIGKITGDTHRLKAMIIHLCENALDAMPDGGVLTLQTEKKGRQIILKVIDTGTGVSRALIDKIWDPFFSTRPGHSGLGLSICRQVVKGCRGGIEIKSGETTGTMVTVSLPRKQLKTADPHDASGVTTRD